MDAPAEVTFGPLLLSGIGLMLLAAGSLVVFVVAYQKRLLREQLHLRAAEAVHQQQLLLAVIEAQEEERARIGRDLHDDVGSTIAMAKLLVDRLEGSSSTANTTALLKMAREVLGSAVHEVRSVSHNLYPAVLARVGLAKALEYLAEVSSKSSTLAVVLAVDYRHPLTLSQELALYRICQELVHNAMKHAQGATRLAIRLRQTEAHLTLVVEDDGCGFSQPSSADALPVGAGAGLRSIGVRVQMLQARLHHRSVPGQGTCISVEVAN